MLIVLLYRVTVWIKKKHGKCLVQCLAHRKHPANIRGDYYFIISLLKLTTDVHHGLAYFRQVSNLRENSSGGHLYLNNPEHHLLRFNELPRLMESNVRNILQKSITVNKIPPNRLAITRT